MTPELGKNWMSAGVSVYIAKTGLDELLSMTQIPQKQLEMNYSV